MNTDGANDGVSARLGIVFHNEFGISLQGLVSLGRSLIGRTEPRAIRDKFKLTHPFGITNLVVESNSHFAKSLLSKNLHPVVS